MNWTFGLHIDIQKNRIVNICSRKRTQFQVPLPICIFSLLFLDVFFLSRFAEIFETQPPNEWQSHQYIWQELQGIQLLIKWHRWNEWMTAQKETQDIHRDKECVCVVCVSVYTKHVWFSFSRLLTDCISCGVAVV